MSTTEIPSLAPLVGMVGSRGRSSQDCITTTCRQPALPIGWAPPLSASAPGPVQPWSATRLLLTQSSDKGRGEGTWSAKVKHCRLFSWGCFVFCFVLDCFVLGYFVVGWLVLAVLSQHRNLLSASGPHTVNLPATIRWFSFEITSIRNTSYSVCFCTWLVTSTMLGSFQLWSDIFFANL